MEDEKGDVSIVSSGIGGVSEPPSTVDSRSETLIENSDGEKQVDDFCEEGEVDEIMVEVVGSDLFVDGVSTRNEGDLEFGEVGDLEESEVGFDESFEGGGGEITELPSEGVTVVNNELSNPKIVSVTEEVIERSVVVSESLDGGGGEVTELPLKGVAVVDDEMSNIGIVSVTEEVTERSVVVSEVTELPSEGVPNDEVIVAPAEEVIERTAMVSESLEGGGGEITELPLKDVDAVNDEVSDPGIVAATEEVMERTVVVSESFESGGGEVTELPSKGVSTVVNDEISNPEIVAPSEEIMAIEDEPLNHPVETFVEGEIGVVDKLETSNSGKNSEETSIIEATEVEDVGLVNGDCGAEDTKAVEENELNVAESENPALETEPLVENHASTEAINEESLVFERGEVTDMDFDVVLDFEDGELSLKTDEDRDLEIETQADLKDNQQITTSSPPPGDTEQVAKVVNDQKAAISQDEVMVDAEILPEEVQEVNASDENTDFSTKGAHNFIQSQNQEFTEQILELPNHGTVPNEVANNSVDSDVNHVEILQEKTGAEIDKEFDEKYGEKKVDFEETTEAAKSAISLKTNQFSPPENDGDFSVSDLVWGKVKSHPWWPGQIIDPKDASEKAIKYYKKETYLVAYFGDGTFAWNEASVLKPFGPHFSEIENQSNSETFQHAVTCALEEVSRRVEFGLACSCVPDVKNETWVLENNTGIRQESSHRYNEASGLTFLEPGQLLKYVQELAPGASSESQRMDLVIAKAQLSAFCRLKGYRLPTQFPSAQESLENGEETEQKSEETIVASHKRKNVAYSPDGEDGSTINFGKKLKSLDSLTDAGGKNVNALSPKVSTTPKPSFKLGECIRRVASQLTGSTGSTSIVKSQKDDSIVDVSAEPSSVNEMLLKLRILARYPKKTHQYVNSIRPFFSGFRSSIAMNKRGRKRKTELTVGGSGEEFEFDDVNDSYWTDRIVQNYSEEQFENGSGNLQVVPVTTPKASKTGRKTNSRKRFSTGGDQKIITEIDESAKRRKQDSSPAELILLFDERNRVPSEINLNKMFRRFGPLMESETEVDHESGRAKVIFKRGSDAEVAHDSAEKFSIFGPVLVNYQIGYSPLISVKVLPIEIQQLEEDPTLMMQ